MDILLDEDIERRSSEPMDVTDWFKQLQEAISEGLLSPKEISDLLDNPRAFLIQYTNSTPIASQIYDQIIRSFFISSLEMKEKKEDTRAVLTEQAINCLNDKMRNTDLISAVDLSIIYKNIKKES